ncbi:MAG: hypothetical protein K2G52_02165 [Muribaculaceae bacterium]|nr:hypothetical protein [Muribaculaceae bacterium]
MVKQLADCIEVCPGSELKSAESVSEAMIADTLGDTVYRPFLVVRLRLKRGIVGKSKAFSSRA